MEHPGIPAVEEFVSLVCRVCACFGGIVEVLLINSASSGQIGSPVKLQSGSLCMKYVQLSESVKHVAFLEVLIDSEKLGNKEEILFISMSVFLNVAHQVSAVPTEDRRGHGILLETRVPDHCELPCGC